MTRKKRKKISIADFSEWKDSEVTQAFYRLLETEVDIAAVGLGQLSGTVEEIGAEYIRKKSYINACTNIMQLTVDDLNFILGEA